MKRATFLGLAAAAVSAAILPTAQAKTAHPTLAPFHAIVIEGAARLDVTEAPTQSVTVTASPSDLKRLELTVTDGVLHVAMKSGTIFQHSGTPHLAVTAAALDSIVVSGVAHGTVSGLTGPSFHLAIRGTGSFTLTGTVTRADLVVSGTGSIDARKLLADDLTVDISGAGSLHAYASKSADIVVDGVGAATIAGNPPRPQSRPQWRRLDHFRLIRCECFLL